MKDIVKLVGAFVLFAATASFVLVGTGAVIGGTGSGGAGEYAGHVSGVTAGEGAPLYEVSYFEAYHSESSETETFCVPDDRSGLILGASNAAADGSRVVIEWEDPLYTAPWDCPAFSKVAVDVRLAP